MHDCGEDGRRDVDVYGEEKDAGPWRQPQIQGMDGHWLEEWVRPGAKEASFAAVEALDDNTNPRSVDGTGYVDST